MGPSATCAPSSTAVALPHQAQTMEGEPGVQVLHPAHVGGHQHGQAPGGHDGAAPHLVLDPPAHPVRHGRETVDGAGLDGLDGGPAHHVAGLHQLHLRSMEARAKRASRLISIPGRITPPRYSPWGETTSKVVAVPKSTTMRGAR